MSKLPNAPLEEAIFEIRWKVADKHELTKCQYIHGDLFARVKNSYPYREALVAPEMPIELCIGNPTHRFRFAPNEYPLLQIGPGLITINTIDEKYIWEDFEGIVLKAISDFFEIYEFSEGGKITLSLQYFDFFKFDFENQDVLLFLNQSLNFKVEQNFLNKSFNPVNFNLGLYYPIADGITSVQLNRGQNLKGEDGIILQTSITSNELIPNFSYAKKWLETAHNFCSSTFKEITKGPFYETFK